MADSDETQYRAGDVPEQELAPTGIPRVGDVLAEKYRVERLLGVGGMGVVVAVTHLQLGEPYAIKCLLPQSARDTETVARFMREARAAVRIKSEHIARVSDVGQLADGSPYILMEYLVGRDLADVLASSGPLAIRDAVEYVLQACAGIAEAHALGIVHRDLKPSNLFLTQRLDGEPLVKVLDFGISKATGETAGPHAPSLTQTTSVFGSPAYMSPEQLRSAKNVDARTDVWGLGVILHELIAGECPFVAETSSGLLAAIAADEPTSLRAKRPDVSEELDAIVRRCLEKKVEKRFQGVSDLALALEPFRSETSRVSIGRIVRLSAPAAPVAQLTPPVPARPVAAGASATVTATESPWTTGVTHQKRGRALVVLVAVALAAALGAGVFYLRPVDDKAVAHEKNSAPPPSVLAVPAPAPPTPAADAPPAAPAGVAAVASASSPAAAPSSARARRVQPRQPLSGHGAAPAAPAVTGRPVTTGATTPVATPPAIPTRDPLDTSH